MGARGGEAVSYGDNWNYDPETDAWYIYVSDAEICKTETLPARRIVSIDYDAGGQVVGVELL